VGITWRIPEGRKEESRTVADEYHRQNTYKYIGPTGTHNFCQVRHRHIYITPNLFYIVPGTFCNILFTSSYHFC
jgi:hypothetical protein